jgi:hypothetical protein
MTQMEQLNEEFPEGVLGTLPKGGKKLSFVPVAEVIQRLNNVLGTGNWSYTVVNQWREDDIKGNPWVLAHVSLSATITSNGEESRTTRSGIGGYDHSNKGMDLADAYKSAVSEALKKAAQTLGVGLHLSRKEEAIAIEAMATDSERPRADVAAVAAFTAEMADLSDYVKGEVKVKAREINASWSDMTEADFGTLLDVRLSAVQSEQQSEFNGGDYEETA